MDEIVKTYNSCGDCELEYKLRISYNRFVELYNKLLSEATGKCVTTTANFIDRNRNIRQVTFRVINNEENREENIYNKQKLQEIKSDNYKLSLSREKIVSRFDKKNISVIRVKLRSSLVINNWSYDFTVSRQFGKESLALAPSIVNEFKKINNPMSFVADIEYLLSDSQLEFEIEYVGGNTIDIEEIKKPLSNVDIEQGDIIYQDILFRTAELLQPKKAEFFKQRLGYKHLSKQVKGLSKEFYVENYKKLLVTDKLDGERATILLLRGKSYMFGSKMFKIEDNRNTKDTIVVDGEYHIESDTFYSFEVPYYNKRLASEDATSVKTLQKAHKILKNHKIKNILKNTPENINKLVHEIREDYETDGLIFIDPSTGISYKWKPVNQSTIDFLIKKIPPQLLGKEPYLKKNGLNTYVLMVGITYQDFEKYMIELMPQYNKIILTTGKYFPIQFSPPNCPYCHVFFSKDELDSKIGEFLWDLKSEEWKLIRIREDRAREASKGTYFGNNYAIAEEIWMYLSAPITLEFLQKPNLTQYFKKSDPALLPQRNFNRFVRHYLYEYYRGDRIIDLASGQGQGVRAIINNYNKALMIDIDADALVELRRRVREMPNTNKTRFYVQQLDLNEDFRDNMKKLSKLNFPNAGTIMCHFAIHYMLGSDTLAKNFLCLVNNLSIKGTYFIFTAYNGRKVFSLPPDFEIKSGTRTINKIVKKYKSNKLENTGQKIDVLLPFSDGELYEENLVNIDYIISLMRKIKFKLVENRPFSHLFEQFKAHNKAKFDELTDNDKKYLDLYSYVVFQKQ